MLSRNQNLKVNVVIIANTWPEMIACVNTVFSMLIASMICFLFKKKLQNCMPKDCLTAWTSV